MKNINSAKPRIFRCTSNLLPYLNFLYHALIFRRMKWTFDLSLRRWCPDYVVITPLNWRQIFLKNRVVTLALSEWTGLTSKDWPCSLNYINQSTLTLQEDWVRISVKYLWRECVNVMTSMFWPHSILINSNPIPFRATFGARVDRCILCKFKCFTYTT